MTLLRRGLGSFSSYCAEFISEVAETAPESRELRSRPSLGGPWQTPLGVPVRRHPSYLTCLWGCHGRRGSRQVPATPGLSLLSSPPPRPCRIRPFPASTTRGGGCSHPGRPGDSQAGRRGSGHQPHHAPFLAARSASTSVGNGETPRPCLVFIYLLPEAVNSSAFLPSTFFSFLLYFGTTCCNKYPNRCFNSWCQPSFLRVRPSQGGAGGSSLGVWGGQWFFGCISGG